MPRTRISQLCIIYRSIRDILYYRTVGFMKRVCSVYTLHNLSIPYAHNQLRKRFSGYQLYLYYIHNIYYIYCNHKDIQILFYIPTRLVLISSINLALHCTSSFRYRNKYTSYIIRYTMYVKYSYTFIHCFCN